MKKPIYRSGEFSVAIACFCVLVFVGCSDGRLPTEHVTGTVTLDGQPLADAQIFFNPVEGGIPAHGWTNEQGVYLITAMQGGGTGAGTVPGDYVVTVTKIEVTLAPDGESGTTTHLLPPIYRVTDQSPLRATVVKGRNRFDFELQSVPDIEFKPPPGWFGNQGGR